LKERLAADTTDAALAWLAGRDPAAPFFLWVHYQDPHGPYTPPEDCLASFPLEARGEEPLEVGPDQKVRGALPPYQVVDEERRPEAYRARYEAEIRYFDRELGRLLEELERGGFLARATVAFTADHGESLGEDRWWFSHGQTLRRELVQVPLVIVPRGGAAAPARVRLPVSHLDLLPTALAAIGLPAENLRGLDLLAGAPPEERVLPQFLRGAWSATSATHQLVMERATPALFELASDTPTDLAAREPELVRDLQRRHGEFLASQPRRVVPAERGGRDEAEERALRELGYAGGESDGDDE
jgi:arylsulfatase A-like enzyme